MGLGSISQSLTNKSLQSNTADHTTVTSTKEKKTKFVPLFSEEGQSKSVAKLPGE